ncbi:putative short-subunit dehydrogenase-like oxidoreductase (DUF2520 family) [Dysgonomonas alginatilytica]|uniref:Putative short-subunit dehydrogenase-like oxidoreductase (DUF2520 family) n=1 Tax=Dysgonomonas alginatilytica TaxID=1605892 RepID=A0A2V3PLR3_9BACT|nr:Rossmann-like and DUF2520 domain-containing protein [Dysgonomonas alginatilytica]PXV60954.1 putative short-subunit dehydrogenase-like oxidoreductase (DUF2520 family) [Dysgonomonas alginatilytica]
MNIVFIGAGKLATHLAVELTKHSFNIQQVYSRTDSSAQELAKKVNSRATSDIKKVDTNADIYIFSVKDSALPSLIAEMPVNNGLWLHTAGSITSDIFKGHVDRYGVLYPFQTFSKDRQLNFREIPIFIEANNKNDLSLLENICLQISDKVYALPSEKRQYLHLTGVFACNFVNHMYAISQHILEKENIPFETLLPLIDETASKVHSLSPQEAQTGPAIRYDENVIQKHIDLIEDPDLKEIYSLISKNIHKTNKS